MHDLVIEDARIVDGTGGPSRHGSVAVRDGRIVEVGGAAGQAARERLRADGRVVAPGFIDPHTHYDAQVAWDPLLTSSSWHGITTVVTGNCGVGVAPCRPEAREVLMGDLVNVEAIPLDVMRRGIDWTWESFPQWMDALGRAPLGINVAPLVPLTPLRHHVLGDASFDRAATADETAAMARLLDDAMAAGAFGFSTTILPNHVGDQGRPLACRRASADELRALAGVLRRRARGAIEIALTAVSDRVSDEELSTLTLLVEESRRPVTFLAVFARPGRPPGSHEQGLERVAHLLGRDRAVPQVSCRPLRVQFTLKNPFIFAGMTPWAQAFNRTPAEQTALYRSEAFRAAWKAELERRRARGLWPRITIRDAASPAVAALAGQSIADIAAARTLEPADAFLDVGLEDGLDTLFDFPVFNQDPEAVRPLVTDGRFLIGLSDGGAHVDQLCDAGYATYLLGKWVRQWEALTLERAVHRLTGEVADFFGVPDRGRLAAGAAADLVVFDPATVDDCPPEYVHDLPNGAKRLVARARGVAATVVAGQVVYREGEPTGARPGRVLRGGFRA
jgi:N-acyl-D-aspartate/D-glutamate deacylase